MRFQLFKCQITRSNSILTCFVIASDKHRASEIVLANEIELGRENQGFTLERADETIPVNMRKGLDALLECAPTGLASYCEPIGWIAHAIPSPKLRFFRIEELDGGTYFVIAPTMDLAIEVYSECTELEEGENSIFNVQDGTLGLKNEGLRGLHALLEFGPIGLVHWNDETGWTLK